MAVAEFLKENKIDYVMHEHPPVYTCEEAAIHCSDIPGIASKNLLLKDKKSEKYFLVIIAADKKLDNRQMQDFSGAKKIRFGNPDELDSLMGLTPGSVSPLGLINDTENNIIVLIDQDVWESDIVSFHPNRNNATLEIKKDMFHKLMKTLGNQYFVKNFK